MVNGRPTAEPATLIEVSGNCEAALLCTVDKSTASDLSGILD